MREHGADELVDPHLRRLEVHVGVDERGVSAAPSTSTTSGASRGPSRRSTPSTIARSVVTHSRVPGTKTVPPVISRSAGSSPLATARMCGRGAAWGHGAGGSFVHERATIARRAGLLGRAGSVVLSHGPLVRVTAQREVYGRDHLGDLGTGRPPLLVAVRDGPPRVGGCRSAGGALPGGAAGIGAVICAGVAIGPALARRLTLAPGA